MPDLAQKVTTCLWLDSQPDGRALVVEFELGGVRADGGEESQCGWLEDRFGLSWQIVPRSLSSVMTDPDPERVARVVAAFMPMKKLELATLEAAYRGR